MDRAHDASLRLERLGFHEAVTTELASSDADERINLRQHEPHGKLHARGLRVESAVAN